jgi:hypothetical protein
VIEAVFQVDGSIEFPFCYRILCIIARCYLLISNASHPKPVLFLLAHADPRNVQYQIELPGLLSFGAVELPAPAPIHGRVPKCYLRGVHASGPILLVVLNDRTIDDVLVLLLGGIKKGAHYFLLQN